MKRTIIGEGSYGCVHKPSIHCKTLPKSGFDYAPYVSKLMKTKNARDELAEFVVIKNIDPTEKYHLGEPILCSPDLDEPNVKKDIGKCKHIKLTEIEAKPNDYSLLLMKYGGPDLKQLCSKHMTLYLKTKTEFRTDKFWLEAHHLLKGLKFFKDNGIVHNDIKPQNILISGKTYKMKYIDFGLMRTKTEVINSSKSNNNYLGIFHWSYPFDCGFMDKSKYKTYNEASAAVKISCKNELNDMIVSDKKINTFNLPIKHPDAFKILFTYLNPDATVPDVSTQSGYIESFFDGFNELIDKNSYDHVLEHIVDSIDVFGLGFTMQFMTNCFKHHNALNLLDYTRLSSFFHKMYDFNPLTRTIDIDALINEYENILLEIGVLTRLGKSFKNNMLVNKPPEIIAQVKSASKSPLKRLSPALQAFADKDAIEISVNCPTDKEFNPITKRCVKKCKPGFTRNAAFKCHSSAKKTRKINSVNCPSDKDFNPSTKRCVKKCNPGFSRNAAFQCRKKVKQITSKSKSKSNKPRSIIV
jgi:serine/threonine protein kinase